MARTSTIFARVEPEIKEQAEQVLDQGVEFVRYTVKYSG